MIDCFLRAGFGLLGRQDLAVKSLLPRGVAPFLPAREFFLLVGTEQNSFAPETQVPADFGREFIPAPDAIDRQR